MLTAATFTPPPPTPEYSPLRGLSDEELKALHRRAQVDFVARRGANPGEWLECIERELVGRRLSCR